MAKMGASLKVDLSDSLMKISEETNAPLSSRPGLHLP